MQPINTPDLQPQNLAPERAQAVLGQDSQPTPEGRTVARAEQAPPTPAGMPQQLQAQAQVASVAPVAQTPVPAAAPPAAPHSDLETEGGDNIEKPWVDRADAIMKEKAEDPYAEEEAHEDLSAAYLKKRFNLEIKRGDSR